MTSRYVPGYQPTRRGPATTAVDHRRVADAVRGEPVELTTAELAAAIDAYDVDGRSAADVARRLRCSDRTVVRRRAARRAQPTP